MRTNNGELVSLCVCVYDIIMNTVCAPFPLNATDLVHLWSCGLLLQPPMNA